MAIPYYPFFDGKVYFGVRRGTLDLVLENCRLPLEKVALAQELKLTLEVEKQGESGIEAQVGTASSFKTTDKKSVKIKDFLSRVQQTGGEQSPKWIFASEIDGEPLLGHYLEEKLGTIEVEARPCKVTAYFTLSSEDVWISRGRVGFAEGKTLSANKLAHLERSIAIHYIGKQLDIPVSEIGWEYV
jgi:hypothetical protein